MKDSSPADAPAAVVLLSGGLDSATTLAIARAQGYACHALSFDYGQRHRVELEAASRVAGQIGVASHRCVKMDRGAFDGFAGSALTDPDIAVPKSHHADTPHSPSPPGGGREGEPTITQRVQFHDEPRNMKTPSSSPSRGEGGESIPVTYVPARNTLFLSYALALAEVLSARAIFLGVTAVDYSGYPDCRPEFIAAFERVANLATKAGVEAAPDAWLTIHAPLIDMSKVEIIRRGLELGVDYALTHSCYDPVPDENHPLGARPCGRCDSCVIRRRAFEALGRVDPAV